MTVTYYQREIAKLAPPSYDPRHIEAYMRLGHATLGGLTASRFKAEIKLCMACVDEAGNIAAERCAKSFGL